MYNFLLVLFICGFCICESAYAEILRGPIINPENNHSYYLLAPNTWDASEAEAVTFHGHLVTIRNSSENQWIYSTFFYLNGSPIDLWLGLNKKINQTWVWSSGDNSTYRKWTETSDVTGIHNCAHFWKNSNDGWWNQTCDSMIAYGVVEVSNQLPTLTSFTASPKSGNPPLTVNFNVAAKDPDGSIASYQWDFDGDGKIDSTTTIGNATHTYLDLGIFKSKVTIVDNQGGKVVSNVIQITVAYGPDLIGKVETYDFSDATNTIHIDFKVSNTGNIATIAFKVRFHLSNNGTTLLPAFKEMDVSQGLGVCSSTVLSVDNTFTDSIYGKYIFVIIDSTKQVAEVDETNNGTKIVIQPVATK